MRLRLLMIHPFDELMMIYLNTPKKKKNYGDDDACLMGSSVALASTYMNNQVHGMS